MRRRAILGACGLAALLLPPAAGWSPCDGGLCSTDQALAAAPPLARDAYVGNEGDGTVSVVDLASGAVVGGPIAAGAGAGAIAMTPDGGKVYVANHAADTVSVIDTEGDEVVGPPIAVGEGPRGVAVSPDGARVYVANQQSGTISVIDTASDEVVDEFLSLSGARGIAVSPDGRRLYVGRNGSSMVSVIDTETGEPVGEPITVGLNPQGIAFTPDGRKAYVASLAADTVSAIDTATEAVIATIPVDSLPVGVAISPDGAHAYVASDGPDTVSVIDTATDTVVGEPIEVPSGPRGVAFAPDGRHAYVTTGFFSSDPGTVTAIDTASEEPVGEPITVGAEPLGIAIIPNQPPLAALAPADGVAGQPVQLDASASRDPDGQIIRYDWSFGDGETALDAGPTPDHTYSAPGAYQVTVTVDDGEGCPGFVFTGVSATCNGPSVAGATRTVQVSAPPSGTTPPTEPPTEPPPLPTPRSDFHIHKLHPNKRRGFSRLTIWVPGPGVVLLRGRRVRSLRRRVGRSRSVTLVVRAKRGHGRLRTLRRHGHLKVRARITFRPDGGSPLTRTKKLKLVRHR